MQKQHCTLDRINLIETQKLQAATERGALAEAWRCCRGSENCGLATSSPAFEAWRKATTPTACTLFPTHPKAFVFSFLSRYRALRCVQTIAT